MKNLAIASLVFAGFAAHTSFAQQTLNNFNFVDLMTASDEVVLNIPYPGMHNERCFLELRGSHPLPSNAITKLAKAIEIVDEEGLGGHVVLGAVESKGVLNYKLKDTTSSLYMTQVTIRSKSGESLAKTIRNTFAKTSTHRDASVIVMARDCQ